MRLLLTLTLLLALVGTGYADTLTVQVDRDNGSTQITDKLVLNPANLGAQPDVKDSAGLDIYQNATGARFPYIDFHSSDLPADYTARIAQWNNGSLDFFHGNTSLAATDTAFGFRGGKGVLKITQPSISQFGVTAPDDAWNMYPAITNAIEFPALGSGAYSGFGSWIVAASPTPAQAASRGSTGASWGIYGQEINVFERHADAGYKENTNGKVSVAQNIVPESELNTFGGTWQQGFNASYGIRFAHSLGSDYGDIGGGGTGGARQYPAAKTHIPLLFDTDCTTTVGTTALFKGGASVGTQANKTIKATGYHNDVIDTSDATVAGSVLKMAPAQTLSDGTVTKTLAQLAAGPTATSATIGGVTTSGNTTVAATVSGPKTAGKQITFDASGNVIASAYDAGATGGGGSGTVSSGTTGQFAYYSGAGTTVTGRTLVAGDIPAIPESGVTNLTTDLAAKAPLAPTYITLGADATLTNERVLTGTTNQITVTDGGAGGAVTLSLPQSINTGAVTRFAGLNINAAMGAAAGEIKAYGTSPLLYLQNSTQGASSIQDSVGALAITKTSTTGPATIDITPVVSDGTSAASFRFFRTTNTSGAVGFDLMKGDNTSSINSHFDGKSDSYVQALSGNFGIGKNNPSTKLDVNGTIAGTQIVTTGDAAAKTFTPTIPAATTYAATTTIDLALGDSPSVTLTGNPTLAFSNPKAGQWHRLNLIQDGAGSRTVTWPSTGLVCSWRNTSGNTAPTLLIGAGKVDTIIIHTLSTTSAECWTAGNK